MSSWLVEILLSGMEMIERRVYCASALMKEVLPVPGGPYSRKPSCRWGGRAGGWD